MVLNWTSLGGIDMNTSKLVEGGAGPETTQTLKAPLVAEWHGSCHAWLLVVLPAGLSMLREPAVRLGFFGEQSEIWGSWDVLGEWFKSGVKISSCPCDLGGTGHLFLRDMYRCAIS